MTNNRFVSLIKFNAEELKEECELTNNKLKAKREVMNNRFTALITFSNNKLITVLGKIGKIRTDISTLQKNMKLVKQKIGLRNEGEF